MRTVTSSSWTAPTPPHRAWGHMNTPSTRHSPAIQPSMTSPARAWAAGSHRGARRCTTTAAHWKPPTTTPSSTAASAYRPAKAVPSRRNAK